MAKNVGILAVDIYFPPSCIQQEALEAHDGASKGKYTIGLGQDCMAFCSEVEDVISMSLTVVTNLLEKYGVDPKQIGRLEVGSETVIDKSKSIKTFLMQIFEKHGNTDIEGVDSTNACYGGTAALFNCVNWVESSSWDGRYGLVVCTDSAVYAEGPARPTGGAAAIAMLIGPDAPIAFESKIRGSHMSHVYDFYKPDLASEYPVVDGKLSQTCYLMALDSCYKQLCKKYEKIEGKQFSISDAEYFVFHSPYNKLVQKSFARLVFQDSLRNACSIDEAAKEKFAPFASLSSDESYASRDLEKVAQQVAKPLYDAKVQPTTLVPKQVGNMYTASLYAAFASLLHNKHESLDGKRVILFSYGSGSTATMFSLQLRAGQHPFSLKNIAAVMNVGEKLKSRHEFAPEKFCEIMKIMEHRYGGKDFVTNKDISLLLPGTFYLTEVDSKYRRFYAQKDGADEEAFLKGTGDGVPSLKHAISESNNDDFDIAKFDFVKEEAPVDLRDGPRKGLNAETMKENIIVDPSVETKSPLCSTFFPLDQQDWEEEIFWGNSPVTSNKSVESCEISGPDEPSINSETEPDPGTQKIHTHSQKELDEKDHSLMLHSYSTLLEPFGSRNFSGSPCLNLSDGRYHPQLLRLESRCEVEDHADGRVDNSGEKLHKGHTVRHFSKHSSKNRDILEGSWLDQIIWDPDIPIRKPKLILDLEDEQMLFEISDNKDCEHLKLHSGAMIVTRPLKSSNGDSSELPHHGGQFGWRYVANDKHYSNRKTSQQLKSNSKKRTAQGIKIYHSQPALMLQTMKLKLSNKDVANFHRPKALWYPHDIQIALKEQGKLSTQGPMRIIIKSLGGKGSKFHADAEETVSYVKAKASKKLDFKPSETVKMFYLGRELEDDKTLAAQNVQPNTLVHLVRTKICLLPRAQKLPGENKSLRPPGAFKKKSDLSVKDGHVFLIEYCEERPLLLSNVGMGARLCTYYHKSAPDDQTGSLLRNENSSLGHVISLNPADKSPFLGDTKAGCSQSSLETNMYRAPAFSHKVPSTDYLLVRSAKGKLSIRRIDRLNVVGQQEPLMEVMSPGTKNLQNYMINRLLVYICREFRAAEKRHSLPCVRAEDLPSQFPYLTDSFIKKKLKELANLQKGSNGRWIWVKKRNFRIFSEDELRNMVKPEEVCAYESMQAGLYRLKHLGITETHPSAITSAMSRLPDEAITLAAASHIERELQITPWNLSSNFVACTLGRETIERLEICGVGDPSGRGLGFSYVRAAPKASMSSAVVKKKSAAGRGGSTVTGTDSDLRRLSMEAAREVLLKFGVSDELIARQTRWHRIAMIRKLSSEQAASGVKVDANTISKYARGQRMSFLQLQQQNREKCQEIWERQVQSLSAVDGDENESDSEGNNSDLDSFAGDLENLLDAEECEEGLGGKHESNHDKADGVKGLKMRRRPSLAQAEEENEDEAAEAAELCRLLMDDDETERKRKKKTSVVGDEARSGPGSRTSYVFENADRRKQIIDAAQPDGSYTSKENPMGDVKVMENPLKRNKTGKPKGMKQSDSAPMGLTNKILKISGDVSNKMYKEKKSARDSFVCGACHQLGHMRTNKNCPMYGEDPETHRETPDLEKISGKSSQSQKTTAKKPNKSAAKIAGVEASDVENPKVLPLIFRYGSTEKVADKQAPGETESSEWPAISDPEIGKSTPKFNKIILPKKMKPENVPVESHKPSIVIRPPTDVDRGHVEPQKPNIVIRPPANTDRDLVESQKPSTDKQPSMEAHKEQLHKKIIIKRPKEIIDLDQDSQDGTTREEHRKTKRIVELTNSGKHRNQDDVYFAKETAKKKARDDRRLWEEQEKRRKEDRLREERVRRLYEEEMRMIEEKERVVELRRYEAAIRQEREEEERQKARNKKNKKRPAIRDDYSEDSQTRRFDNRMPERDRGAKRRPVVELGKYGAESAASTKRRRGGEVGLANILEHIVETLKERIEVSYLFLKPVSKKEAPDYLNFVERPMDLSTIREKVRKMEYKCREQFRHDVAQITINAHLYNDGRNPGIPPLADQLLEICDYMLIEIDESLTEAEAGIESDY